MARRAATALIVTLLALDVPLRAQQTAPDTPLQPRAAIAPDRRDGAVTTVQAMQIMDKYGECLVSERALLVRLTLMPTSTALARERAFIDRPARECYRARTPGYDVNMRFNAELLRASIFKALYRQGHAATQPVFGRNPIDWQPITTQSKPDAAKRFLILHRIAECTLAAAPTDVHQLVLADYGSDPHRAAFAALAPVIGNCLPEGMQLELPRPSLAGALAEVAWRKANISP